MPRTPKGVRFGGRQKGTRNKRTRFSVAAVLEQAGKSPVDEVLKILPFLEAAEQARIWLKLQEYIEPKAVAPLSLEVTNPEVQSMPSENLLAVVNGN